MTITEPDITNDLREMVKNAIKSQKQLTQTVLSSLLAVQGSISYIPDVAIEEIASFCGTTINDVWSVASFYTNFRFTPPGNTILDICWGPTCHLMGAQEILRSAQETLDVEGEETTDDGEITLRYSTCLGACAQAPVIGLNHHLKGRSTPKSVSRIISGLRK